MTAPDPRVFFAAERTLLAWVRTGLGVMALGFVVERFGLFLALVGLQSGPGRTRRWDLRPRSAWRSPSRARR